MNYRGQIRKQMPKDFVMFTEWVQVMEYTVVHEAVAKNLLNHKRKRAWLEIGGLIMKPTIPDLLDNLSKLPFDCMSQKRGLKGVYRDDCLVYMAKEVSKWWGLNPRIEIKLIGV